MRLRDRIAAMSPAQRSALDADIATWPPEEIEALAHDWRELLARDDQLPPSGEWTTWLLLAGRGFGKTRTAAEWVRMQVEDKAASRIALVGPTAADVRDTMVEGESGLLSIFPPGQRPVYEPSKRRITFHTGAIATTFSAEEPDRLRGPQHDLAWADELCAWKYAETWDQLQFGLRLGKHPRQVVSTTPRPTKQLRELIADPRTVMTRGRTLDNAANLAPAFLSAIKAKYEGTRLGRQELEAEVLDDNPGALWRYSMFDSTRVPSAPPLRRIVIGIDPAVTHSEGSDETGIVVAGLGEDGRGYVLEDLTMRDSVTEWGRVAVQVYHHYQADRIVAEGNNGGDLIEAVLRGIDPNISYQRVHARVGKFSRAEPVAALYEQGRVSHVGMLPKLEDECCQYDPTIAQRSPNRMDALVWALTALMLDTASSIVF